MTRDERIDAVTAMCTEHGCKPKIRQIHFEQFVDRKWHPHPSKEFVEWWETKGHSTRAVTAWNCQVYREEFAEVKQMIGL